jgi:hypothetical protein
MMLKRKKVIKFAALSYTAHNSFKYIVNDDFTEYYNSHC